MIALTKESGTKKPGQSELFIRDIKRRLGATKINEGANVTLRINRPLAPSALALVALIGLAGCTTQSSKDFTVPPLTKSFNLTNVVLPLDSFQLSETQMARLDKDWGELMTRCAATYGATLSYSSDYTREPDDKTSLWGGPLGTLSKEQASKYGYHAPAGELFQPVGGFYLKNPDNITIEANATPLDNLISYGRPKQNNDPTYHLPLPVEKAGQNLPRGGCWALVQAQIGVSLVSDLDLRRSVTELSYNDSRTQKAISNWSTCMRSTGYSYKTPIDAQKTVGYLNAKEVSLAVADVGCTKSSGWANVFYSLLISYQKQAIAKQPQLLQSVLQSQQKVLKAVSTLVAK